MNELNHVSGSGSVGAALKNLPFSEAPTASGEVPHFLSRIKDELFEAFQVQDALRGALDPVLRQTPQNASVEPIPEGCCTMSHTLCGILSDLQKLNATTRSILNNLAL